MGFFKEFREFAVKGNVVDLAIAVILGAAFGKIVTALSTSFIMPIIGILVGEEGFTSMERTIGGVVFPIGVFIQAVIDFILIAFILFMIVRGINRLKKKEEATPAAPNEDILLLREIRDALKNK